MTMHSEVFSSLVRLNIGGKKFCTTVDTLTQREPDSMLAAMFSGRHTLCLDSEKGYVFIDRDGKHFRHILNWLRDGVVPTLKDTQYSELLREAEYYQLLGLIDGINAILDKRKENEELDTELTRTDIIIKCIQSERVRFRGVNLSGLDLSKLLFCTSVRPGMHIVPTAYRGSATISHGQLRVFLWNCNDYKTVLG
ncbi:potassium channel tetramerization domain-containing protein [Actinidia rufa]|uniref:Potassium channel tetramerization domain-containing protein n=1 Tax=Actinidia rufa TaxID=165716 RepID=A0A7J0FH75_9ERIC|nr:potassium channel tetramerization domain-containing protein [Actinidia rufa]